MSSPAGLHAPWRFVADALGTLVWFAFRERLAVSSWALAHVVPLA